MLARGEPIATPSICRCIMLLKLNSTEEVAVCISSTKTARGKGGGVEPDVKTSYQYVFELREGIDTAMKIPQKLLKSQKKNYMTKRQKMILF